MSLTPAAPQTSLLRLGEAWRNKTGIATLLLSFILSALLVGIGAVSGVMALAGLLGLLAFLVLIFGINAAGIQFMEQAAGRPVSGVLAAFLASPMVVLRMLGLGILLFLLLLAFTAVAALVLLVCKIPFVGALLYVVALPVLVLAAALILLGIYVVSSLAAPALWEGHSLKSALSQLWAVATQRPMEAFLNLLLLMLAAALISFLVFGFLGAGASMIGGLSARILGSEVMTGMLSLYGGGSSSGLATAAMLGAAIVAAIGVALYMAMFMLGLALTYLKLSGDLDTAAAQQAMEAMVAKTRERAQHIADEAKRRSDEARQRSEAARLANQQRLEEQQRANAAAEAPTAALVDPAPESAPAPAPATLTCANCHAAVQPQDTFCGSCGQRQD